MEPSRNCELRPTVGLAAEGSWAAAGASSGCCSACSIQRARSGQLDRNADWAAAAGIDRADRISRAGVVGCTCFESRARRAAGNAESTLRRGDTNAVRVRRATRYEGSAGRTFALRVLAADCGCACRGQLHGRGHDRGGISQLDAGCNHLASRRLLVDLVDDLFESHRHPPIPQSERTSLNRQLCLASTNIQLH
jgi:hypothetical protein